MKNYRYKVGNSDFYFIYSILGAQQKGQYP